MRKYFASTLINNDIKQWSIDAMLGHVVKNRTTNAYFKPDPAIIKNDYFKIVKHLSMEKIDVKTMESPEFIEIQNQLKKQEQIIKNQERINTEKDEQFEKLKREIEAIREIERK